MENKPIMKNDKVLNTITYGLLAVGIICIAWVLVSYFSKRKQTAEIGNLDCVKESTIMQAGDEHMAGIFEKGAAIKIFSNFYNCNDPKNGEYALYRFSEQIEPVVRIVKGVPGDKYNLEPLDKEQGTWKIMINGAPVKAVDGSDYFIKSNTIPPLQTYSESRGGVLLADEYILLSSKPPGLSDSSNLGLIHKKELVGKAVKE